MPWKADERGDLAGTTVVVTGANSGIGYEATKALAQHGATVIMACRSMERANDAKAAIAETKPAGELDVLELDLACLDSIASFTATFKEKYDTLDSLCNNAGVMAIPRQETEDGFEMQLGVNHLGHFALTAHLYPVLQETDGRVVTHSSEAHRDGSMHWDDLMLEHEYDRWEAYAQSKLANLLFAYELDRRTELTSVACHPGFTETNLFPEDATWGLQMMKGLATVLAQSAEQGALPILYAATHPSINGREYIGPDGFMQLRGHPERQSSSEESYDEDVAKRLWERSEDLTGITFPTK